MCCGDREQGRVVDLTAAANAAAAANVNGRAFSQVDICVYYAPRYEGRFKHYTLLIVVLILFSGVRIFLCAPVFGPLSFWSLSWFVVDGRGGRRWRVGVAGGQENAEQITATAPGAPPKGVEHVKMPIISWMIK